MRITVNLDTQAVITQPSPLRIKAGAFVPVEIAFTRGAQSVALPSGAVLEFALKLRNQWTGGLLAYLDVFASAAGNLYTGTLNCATESVLGALGLGDKTPANDVSQVDTNAEVTWSVSGQKFRSSTFSVTVEAPVTDESPVASPDPELYPAPAQIARRSELPKFATTEQAANGSSQVVVMSPHGVSQWFDAKLPGTASLSFLGDGSWGLPDLSFYAGSIAGDGANLTGISGIQLNSLFGNQFYDTGNGFWTSTATLQAPGMNGPYGASFYDSFGTWCFANGIQAPWFSGDGSGLSNVTAYQIYSPYGCSIYDAGWGNWQMNGTLNGSFSGDGSSLSNVNASQLNSPYGYSIYDSGWGSWQVNGWMYGSFSGDGSGLQNVTAQYAQYAYCDEYGNSIAYNYAQQWGYYGSMSVGNADWANNSNYAYNSDWASNSSYASYDQWGYQLQGAGNIQWDFFGGSPNSGDVATFDGNYWTPSPGTPVPITVEDKAGRFDLYNNTLRTGWFVKQLDSRTVYQVLDPNDCATELGWVPVGPFILIPANSTPLVIDNMSPVLGNIIHCTAGTWSDNPASYSYQWNRGGNAINGANDLAYTVVAADDGANLRCLVSATNAAGIGFAEVGIPLVVLNPPVNTVAPSISPSGTPNVGDTLSLTTGTWTGYGYTTAYQWKRAGVAISGATSASYTLAVADAGQAITCTVTRTNIRGSASATTAATASVTNLIAVNTALPTLGTTYPYTGAVVTCSTGTWNYHPTSYSYQWKRSGVAISGATTSSYTVVAGDVGSTISCAVTATNTAGTSGAVSTEASSTVTAVAVSPIQGSIASGLIAHWSMDEASGTRADSSGNGINLTPYANGGTITNATGKFGMAASIPPRSYLAATDSRISGAKTFCGWFKLLAANTSYQRLLISSLQVYSGSSGIAWDKTHYSTGIVPTPGQWYFVCVVSTGTSVKLWVNKQSFTVQNSTAPLIDTVFQIADPSYESVTMLFDDVAVWNRVLTDAEITTLASA